MKKLLIFIVAYNAENKIISVLQRIPHTLSELYDVTILIIDDCSKDNTASVAQEYLVDDYWCDAMVLRNPSNQGYGGNQKLGYRYAIDNGFDVVALLHGDGQYAPECLPVLLQPFSEDSSTGAVFGSRMLNKRDALKGGMPIYKFIGNQILTRMQNALIGSNLSEFHTGYRIYSTDLISQIPFELNTNDFHFDTEIIVQIFFSNVKVVELPIPTYYGDEVCHVNGMQYAWDVTKASIKARLIKFGIFYDPKYQLQGEDNKNYVSKFDFSSTHSIAYSLIPENSVVLDLGCADGYMSEKLHHEKQCEVVSVDREDSKTVSGCTYLSCDLNNELPDVLWEKLDVVVLLDVIEHLTSPEDFLTKLRIKLSGNEKVKVIISSGNVCFFVTRLMMFFGQFNYGRRGILDITHMRLFNVDTLHRLLRYADYEIQNEEYVPAPYPLALGLNCVSKLMVTINQILAHILPNFFAYQSLYVIKPRPSTEWLLQRAVSAKIKMK
jgi:glycosyltransferase involved in cell wall biosynthesis